MKGMMREDQDSTLLCNKKMQTFNTGGKNKFAFTVVVVINLVARKPFVSGYATYLCCQR